ncbi:hypothetical protein C8F04DRAFT_1277735 [Mycena alexandri]|uniref:Uncharacterized protein n=1 Tax=Mycena alexandri TaxID=1745969 RepID=A0AAD6S088_9AGAR|nr:hypothetical protein C8F04DRAFT_1277735 [Mycena alexandri]
MIQTLENVQTENEEYSALIDELYLVALKSFNENLEKYSEMVEQTIDLEQLDSHKYVIKPEYDDQLGALPEKLEATHDGPDSEHEAVGRDLDLELDKKPHLENNPTYVFLVLQFANSFAGLQRHRRKQKYIELGMVKGSVFFTTKTLRSLAEDHRDYSDK